MYNISVSKLTKKPMGQVIIPVGHLYTCGLFGTATKTRTGLDTIITCIKDVCPKYGDCKEFMAQMLIITVQYEYEKDQKIEQTRTRSLKDREVERLDIIDEIAKDTSFQNAQNNDERMQLARFLVPFGTPETICITIAG